MSGDDRVLPETDEIKAARERAKRMIAFIEAWSRDIDDKHRLERWQEEAIAEAEPDPERTFKRREPAADIAWPRRYLERRRHSTWLVRLFCSNAS